MHAQETIPLELSEGSAGFALIKHALDWEDNDRSQIIVYGMSGERVGSHFLESVVSIYVCYPKFKTTFLSEVAMFICLLFF